MKVKTNCTHPHPLLLSPRFPICRKVDGNPQQYMQMWRINEASRPLSSPPRALRTARWPDTSKSARRARASSAYLLFTVPQTAAPLKRHSQGPSLPGNPRQNPRVRNPRIQIPTHFQISWNLKLGIIWLVVQKMSKRSILNPHKDKIIKDESEAVRENSAPN